MPKVLNPKLSVSPFHDCDKSLTLSWNLECKDSTNRSSRDLQSAAVREWGISK
jgi:hypothetical protein